MAHSVSARKRIRQSDKLQTYNRSIKREIATFIKRLDDAIEKKDQDAAQATLNICVSKLDKAQKKGVMHKNTVGHRKSSLWRRVNAMKSS